MVLETRHFGEIEVDEAKILTFKNGIPGFEKLNRFVLLAESNNDKSNPFFWLQSIDDPNIAFVMMDIVKMYPEYDPLVERDIVEKELGSYNQENFYIYNIANIPENISDMTVNLKAPIVINDGNKKGMQVICDNDEYSVRHFVFR